MSNRQAYVLDGATLRAHLEVLGLSGRSLDVLQAIIEFKQAHGYSPSYREIMDPTGIYTKSVLSYHVKKLCEAGWLVQGGRSGQVRTLEVYGGRWRWLPPNPD